MKASRDACPAREWITAPAHCLWICLTRFSTCLFLFQPPLCLMPAEDCDRHAGQVMAVIGAVAGGLAGAAIEEGVTRTTGVEITLKMDDGRTIAVVQGLSPNERYSVGDRVRVISSGQATRVSH
jgi:hypothetical protein